MKYVLMIYQGSTPIPETYPKPTPGAAARGGTAAGVRRLQGGQCHGERRTRAPLGLPSDATTVRVEIGSVVLRDGPYLEPSHAVAGFMVVEAEYLDAAAAVASKLPPARLGGAIDPNGPYVRR